MSNPLTRTYSPDDLKLSRSSSNRSNASVKSARSGKFRQGVVGRRTTKAKRRLFDVSAPLIPPKAYSIVHKGIYRSGLFDQDSYAFISQLRLKTVINLSVEALSSSLESFLNSNNTRLMNLGLKMWQDKEAWTPVTFELIKEALDMALEQASQPCLIMCTSGSHQTGVVVGCLRKLMGWTYSSLVDEFRRFAGPKASYVALQFIETFDPDMVTMAEIDELSLRYENEEKRDVKKKSSPLEALQEVVPDKVSPLSPTVGGGEMVPLVSPGTKFSKKKSTLDVED